MDKKLLLVKCVTLLFRESQLENSSDNSSGLVKTVLEDIKLPEVSVGALDTERDLLFALRSICVEMCNKPHTQEYELTDLLQKIRHATREEEYLYNSFREAAEIELEEKKLKRLCLTLRASLNDYIRETKISDILQKATYKLKFHREEIPDIYNFIQEVTAELEPYQTKNSVIDPAVVGSVLMSDDKSVEDVMRAARELNDDSGIMKTGWQALNRMLQGGFRRGETWVIGALQHNFKTGFTLSIFKHIALYNKPMMINPAKKPLLLRISFEDPLSLNLPFLYRSIYENKTGQMADIKNTPLPEIARYVTSELSVNGYEVMLMHVNPTLWTYRHIQSKILELEADGYEIHMCMLDYMPMVPTTGCNEGPAGEAMRDMYRRMRNFCAAKKITLITPHQLSSDAKQLIRNGVDKDFVKEIAGKGYYDGCKRVDQEVDGELYIHIVKENNESYLTVQRGKHRVIKQTPESHKFCILKFEVIGDIRDDVNGQDLSRKKIGGGPVGSNDETPFYDFSGDDPLAA